VGGDVASIELFAREYPNVNFIIPHLGSFADDWKAQLAIADHVVRHPNVYTDTAGVRRFDYIVETIHRAGAHKVIFGSDGPWLHPGLELEKIRLLELTAIDFAKIAGGNINRLIRPNSIALHVAARRTTIESSSNPASVDQFDALFSSATHVR
jgi:uncharacterized protein